MRHTILVTGGAGFIGSHLSDALLGKGYAVRILDDLSTGKRANLDGLARPHLRDLLQHQPAGQGIRIADHCYGCTAGQGSSCGGALEPAVAAGAAAAAAPQTEEAR